MTTLQKFKYVDLTINRGDHLGIYGKTGSGKSTLLGFMGLIPQIMEKYLLTI